MQSGNFRPRHKKASKRLLAYVLLLLLVLGGLVVFKKAERGRGEWTFFGRTSDERAAANSDFAASKLAKNEIYTTEGLIQGSSYRLSFWTAEGFSQKEIKDLEFGVDSILREIDRVFSLWNPSSILCKINAATSQEAKDIELPYVFVDLFEKSKKIYLSSDGSFDISVAPLVAAYGFAAKERKLGGNINTDSLISQILPCIGFDKVCIKNNRLYKELDCIELDFNAIAQGYSADLVKNYLLSFGIRNYLVDIGGEICLGGQKPNSKDWTIGIEKPAETSDSQRIIQSVLNLSNTSVVTSGNYRKYFEDSLGNRFSHTIDPKIGHSSRDSILSATVICKEAWEADGMATAFMSMGLKKSIDYIEGLKKAGKEPYKVFFIYTTSSLSPKKGASTPQKGASTNLSFWTNIPELQNVSN